MFIDGKYDTYIKGIQSLNLLQKQPEIDENLNFRFTKLKNEAFGRFQERETESDTQSMNSFDSTTSSQTKERTVEIDTNKKITKVVVQEYFDY